MEAAVVGSVHQRVGTVVVLLGTVHQDGSARTVTTTAHHNGGGFQTDTVCSDTGHSATDRLRLVVVMVVVVGVRVRVRVMGVMWMVRVVRMHRCVRRRRFWRTANLLLNLPLTFKEKLLKGREKKKKKQIRKDKF